MAVGQASPNFGARDPIQGPDKRVSNTPLDRPTKSSALSPQAAPPEILPPLWTAIFVLTVASPGLFHGLAPLLGPAELLDALPLEASLSAWRVTIAALTLGLWWPYQFAPERAEEALNLRFARLLSLAALLLPSLFVCAALASSPLPEVGVSAVYLLFLASLLTLSGWALGASASRQALCRLAALLLTIFGAFAALYQEPFIVEPVSWPSKLNPLLTVSDLAHPELLPWALLWALALVISWTGLMALVTARVTGLFPGLLLLGLLSASGASAQDLEILSVEPLFGRSSRPQAPMALTLKLGRAAPGAWRGELGVRAGERLARVPIEVPGGSMDAPVTVTVALQRPEAVPLRFEHRQEGGAWLALPAPLSSWRSLDDESLLVAATDKRADFVLQELLRRPHWRAQLGASVRLERTRLGDCAKYGQSLDLLVCDPEDLSPAEARALALYVAQGGALLLTGGPSPFVSALGQHEALSRGLKFVAWPSVFMLRLGTGVILAPRADRVRLEDLDGFDGLLAQRLLAEGRGRPDHKAYARSFDYAASAVERMHSQALSWALLLSSLSMIAGFLALRRSPAQGWRRVGWLWVWALLVLSMLRFSLLPASPLRLETARFERGVVGQGLLAQTTLMKWHSPSDLSRRSLDVSCLGHPLLYSGDSAADARAQFQLLRLDPQQVRLERAFEAGDNHIFRIHDLRPFGEGLTFQSLKSGKRALVNGSSVALKSVLMISGERSLWRASLAKGGRMTLNWQTEEPWYDTVRDKIEDPLLRNWFYQCVSDNESILQAGGLIVAEADEGPVESLWLNRDGLESPPRRLIIQTWLSSEWR